MPAQESSVVISDDELQMFFKIFLEFDVFFQALNQLGDFLLLSLFDYAIILLYHLSKLIHELCTSIVS